jgi:nucleoid-associated protein YgaU
MFFRGSRYESLPEAELTTVNGRVVRYKRVRFIPDTRGVLPHRVVQGERLDLIAYQAYRDPEQFWRICDANRALRPADLVAEPGGVLLLPIPGT